MFKWPNTNRYNSFRNQQIDLNFALSAVHHLSYNLEFTNVLSIDFPENETAKKMTTSNQRIRNLPNTNRYNSLRNQPIDLSFALSAVHHLNYNFQLVNNPRINFSENKIANKTTTSNLPNTNSAWLTSAFCNRSESDHFIFISSKSRSGMKVKRERSSGRISE